MINFKQIDLKILNNNKRVVGDITDSQDTLNNFINKGFLNSNNNNNLSKILSTNEKNSESSENNNDNINNLLKKSKYLAN